MENPFTRQLKDPETGAWDKREVWARVRGLFAVLLSVALLVGGGYFAVTKGKEVWESIRTVEDYANEAGTADVTISIPPGTSLSKISDILFQADVVKTAKAFDRAAAANADSKKIQAGQYKLRTQIPAKTALAMLLDTKNQIHNRFQVPEGLRLSQILPLLSKATGLSQKEFKTALKDRDALGVPAWVGKSDEGFLFPDTYDIPDKPTATKVLKLMVDRFNDVVAKVNLEEKANELGLTPYEALTLASIVEKEAASQEDRKKVSRVFLNRLETKELLRSDATVAWIWKKTGTVWTTAAERQVNSPYNTYRFAGLPPGPITAPAQKVLEATLNPAEGTWLYFVVVNLDTGETVFSNTNDEHNAARLRLDAFCKTSDKC